MQQLWVHLSFPKTRQGWEASNSAPARANPAAAATGFVESQLSLKPPINSICCLLFMIIKFCILLIMSPSEMLSLYIYVVYYMLNIILCVVNYIFIVCYKLCIIYINFFPLPFCLQLYPTPTVTRANQGNQEPRAVPLPCRVCSQPLHHVLLPSRVHGLKIQLSHNCRQGRAAVTSCTRAGCH